MIIGIYLTVLAFILLGMAGILFVARMRQIRTTESLRSASQVDISRYEPMQRLLSAEDIALVAGDKTLERVLRVQRSRIMRGYLRCMTKDYAALHAAVRQMMVDSGEDRPDLAMLLTRSKYNFAYSLCRIEMSLWLYRAGIGTIDLSGLMAQVQAFGSLVQVPSAAAAWPFLGQPSSWMQCATPLR